MARTETGERLRRFVGLLIAIALGGVIAALGWILPGAMDGTGVDNITPELQPIALQALSDARETLFDEGIESFLVTTSYVDSIGIGTPPEACPERTEYAARIRTRTIWWIPYDDVLWCGDADGVGLLLTRQA